AAEGACWQSRRSQWPPRPVPPCPRAPRRRQHMQSIPDRGQYIVWMLWRRSMTRQNSHRMTESMEEIVYGWDIAKEHRLQDKGDCEYHDHRLLGERDMMFTKQMDLPLNVSELLDGGHRLSFPSL